MKAVEPLEQVIQTQILTYLRYRGILCWKNTTTGIYVKARNTYIRNPSVGVSDISGIIAPSGRALHIEVKRPSGKLSEDQARFLANATEAGALAFKACSVEEVAQKLHEAGYGRKQKV